MTIRQLFGTTAFIGQQHLDNTDKFKLHSYFVGNTEVSHAPNVYGFQQTHQGFKWDEILTQAKERGIDVMWTMQGGFNWMTTDGSVWKRMPINNTDDPLNPANYKYVKEIGFHVAARYGNNPNADRNRIVATLMNASTVPLDGNGKPMVYRANKVKVALGLVNKIRVQNEYNFHVGWSGLTRAFTNQSYAVCLCEVIDGILAGDPNMEIVLGGQLGPDVAYTEELLLEIIRIRGSLPVNLSLDFHLYPRDNSLDQTGGTYALTPEEAGFYTIGTAQENLCVKYNVKKWYITESGWNNSSSTSATAKKQKAPLLEGYTLDQSAGLLMFRGVLNLASHKRFSGITYYHSRDLYDGEPYSYTGLCTKDWKTKERKTLCESLIEQYGDYEVEGFIQINSLYTAFIKSNSEVVNLSWTNLINQYGLTPMPTVIDTIPTPTKPIVEINIQGDLSKVKLTIQ